MNVNPATGDERRAYPRHHVGAPSEFMAFVGVHGSAPSKAEVLNISLGGAMIHILEGGDDMTVGETCFVRFLCADEAIKPDGAFASVRRIEGEGRAPSIAVEFENPLEILKLTSRFDPL